MSDTGDRKLEEGGDDRNSRGDREVGRPSRTGLERILVNAATSQLDRVLDSLIFLVLVPFVIRTVGTEEYGLWSLVWAIVSLFALVDLGFSTSVVKYVADARGRRDIGRLRTVVCTLFWVFVAQSALLGAVTLGIIAGFGKLFDLPEHLDKTAEVVFLVVASGFLIKLPMAMFRGVLVGDQKLWLANAYRIGTNIAYFGAVLLILPLSPRLETFAWLNWIITVLPGVVVALHCAFAMRGELAIRPSYFDFRILREIWGFSAYLMLIQIAALVGTRVDMFVVNWAMPLTAVALYGIALRVSDQARTFCLQIVRTLTPVVAELHSAGAEERLRRVWLTGSRFTVAFATPLMVGCAVLAEPLVVTWVSPDFLGTVIPLQLLLAASLAGLIHGNSQSQLSMRGEHRFLALAMLLGQSLNLALSVGLVKELGLAGVAAATLVGPLATDLCLVQPRLQKRFGVSVARFYRQTVFPSVIPALVMVGVQHAIRRVWTIDSLLEVALLEVLNVVVFWLSFWWIGFAPEERKYVVERLRGRLAGVPSR